MTSITSFHTNPSIFTSDKMHYTYTSPSPSPYVFRSPTSNPTSYSPFFSVPSYSYSSASPITPTYSHNARSFEEYKQKYSTRTKDTRRRYSAYRRNPSTAENFYPEPASSQNFYPEPIPLKRPLSSSQKYAGPTQFPAPSRSYTAPSYNTTSSRARQEPESIYYLGTPSTPPLAERPKKERGEKREKRDKKEKLRYPYTSTDRGRYESVDLNLNCRTRPPSPGQGEEIPKRGLRRVESFIYGW
ncbi:hypothetical protein RUND412_006506 [Rhizina undulata]